MKKTIILTGLFVLIALSLVALSSQNAQDLFQKALAKERAEGNLEEAIALYQKIAEESTDKDLAAKAQLRIGICYEKLGKDEALKAYQAVIERFPNQSEQVAEARARMAELSAGKKTEPFLSKLLSSREDNFLLEAQSLSPDGTKLLGINITWDEGQNVVYRDLTTHKFKFITKTGFAYYPVWSPDSKKVAFNFVENDPRKELRIADLNGESQTVYRCETRNEDIYPCGWFPDSQLILVIHITKEKAIQLGAVSCKDGELSIIYETKIPADASLEPGASKYFQPDLSPDGRHIVFHKADGEVTNLYVVDRVTKTVNTLTDTPAKDVQPQWSPDGKYIAFLSDRLGKRSLWAIPMEKDGKSGGQPFLLRDSMENAHLFDWTTQGLAYANWVSMSDIFILPVEPLTGAPTGKPRQLEYRPTGENVGPVFSPDGKFLAFVSTLENQALDRYVVIYPLSGGEARRFRIPSTNFRGSLFDLRWFPNGSGIGFSCRGTDETPGWKRGMNSFMIFQLELESGEWQTFPLDVQWTQTEWRKDGKGFYYFVPGVNGLSPGGAGIVEKDVKTDDKRYIYHADVGANSFFWPLALRCSRDYTKMAFCEMVGKKIEVINIQSGEKLNEFPRVNESLSHPAWSPDGTSIMVNGGKGTALHVLSLAEGSRKEYDLSKNLPEGEIRSFDWSPDGCQVAFCFRFSQFDTYLIRDVIPETKR